MKLISTILLLFSSFGVFSQKEITWDDLRCEYIEAWSKEYQTTYMAPYLKKNHKELNSRSLTSHFFQNAIFQIKEKRKHRNYFFFK